MQEFTFQADNEADTDRLGAALAGVVPDGTMIALNGTLGAGKTRLVRAVASACGINTADVVSPTFVLCQQYTGRRTICHMDAYRIADDDEFLELGPDEYFESQAISFVEWADRVEACLPPDRLEIEIGVLSETGREFAIRGLGAKLLPVIEKLQEALSEKA